MIRLGLALLVALLLALPAAWAGALEPGDGKPWEVAFAASGQGPEAAPRSERRRLTTEERWRGRPYLKAAEDAQLRGQALDRSIMPSETNFGTTGAHGLQSSDGAALRREALDKSMPVPLNRLNQSFVGGF